jgi:hypothetical protein
VVDAVRLRHEVEAINEAQLRLQCDSEDLLLEIEGTDDPAERSELEARLDEIEDEMRVLDDRMQDYVADLSDD